ncbi:carbohydrate ABC transporter permease [Saccharomonospora azurea]|uniref:carbohydrate ABC transporter permease n=1 Tax=Saccharomonospora azurea TaxID=40988 RepID=UPI003D91C3B8
MSTTVTGADTGESGPAPTKPGRARPRGQASPGEKILRYSLMLIAVAVVILPLLWQVSVSLKSPGEGVAGFPGSLVPESPTLDNYVKAFTSIPLPQYFLNSAIISSMSVVLNLVLATLAGYALARIPFRGRGLYLVALLATAALPFEVILVSTLLVTRSLGLYDTLLGVVLPQAVSIISIFVMRQAFTKIPYELEEAATVDGSGPFRTFWSIMLPLVRNSLAVVVVLGFLESWDQFVWPLVVLSDTSKYPVTVGVEFLSGAFSADQRVMAAAAILVLIPPLLVFFLLQKQVFKGVTGGAVKG